MLCAISASARMSVQENRRATKRSKEAAQGSKMLSPRAFAVKCRQMPGGCGGKMAKRLWRAVQQKTSIHRASPSPSPPPPPPVFVVEHTRIRSPVGLSVSTSVAAGVLPRSAVAAGGTSWQGGLPGCVLRQRLAGCSAALTSSSSRCGRREERCAVPITNEHSTRTTYTTFGIGRRDPSCSGTTDLTSHIASHPELCVEGEARLIRTNFSDELGGVCTNRSPSWLALRTQRCVSRPWRVCTQGSNGAERHETILTDFIPVAQGLRLRVREPERAIGRAGGVGSASAAAGAAATRADPARLLSVLDDHGRSHQKG